MNKILQEQQVDIGLRVLFPPESEDISKKMEIVTVV